MILDILQLHEQKMILLIKSFRKEDKKIKNTTHMENEIQKTDL